MAEPPSLDDALTIERDVVFKDLDGEAVVLNLATGMYFGLDPTSTRLWQLVQQHGRLRAAYEGMLDEFEVEPSRLEQDVLEFARQLITSGLATIAPRPNR